MQTVDLRLDAGWIVPIEPAGALRDHALIVDAGRIVAIVPAAEADRDVHGARTRGTARARAAAGTRQRAHARGDEPLSRHRRRRAAQGLARAAHLAARSEFVAPEFVYDGARLAAAEMLKGGITCCNDMYFFPDATARAFLELGMRAMLGLPILDFPTPYAADADGYLQTRSRHARRVEARAEARVFARAARALHGRRRDVGKDRRVRAPARPADPDPRRRNRARGRAEPRRARVHAARAAARAGRDRARLHRDPRRAPVARRHRAPRDPRRARRALPGLEHEARQRHRAGGGAARATASTSRSAPTARRRTTGSISWAKCASPRCSRRSRRGDPSVLPAQQALAAATLSGARALGLDREIGSLAAASRRT